MPVLPLSSSRRVSRYASSWTAGQGRIPGVLDDRHARLQRAVRLGVLDHGLRDAILDGAARVLHLELDQDPRLLGLLGQRPSNADHRGRSDRVQVAPVARRGWGARRRRDGRPIGVGDHRGRLLAGHDGELFP